MSGRFLSFAKMIDRRQWDFETPLRQVSDRACSNQFYFKSRVLVAVGCCTLDCSTYVAEDLFLCYFSFIKSVPKPVIRSRTWIFRSVVCLSSKDPRSEN